MISIKIRHYVSIVFVLVLLIILAVIILRQFQEIQDDDAVEVTTYQMGEWVDLDNDTALEKERLSEGDAGRFYSNVEEGPLGNWKGTLRIRIDDVNLFDSPSDANIVKKNLLVPSYLKTWKEEGNSLCLVTYTVENVDAEPIDVIGDGSKSFRSEFIHLSGIDSFDTVYFAEKRSKGNKVLKSRSFNLKSGETKTFQDGIVVNGRSVPDMIVLCWWDLGLNVALDCTDNRSKS